MKDWLIGNAYPLQEGKANESNKTSGFSLVIKFQEGKANESNKTSGFSLVIKFFIVNVQSIVIAL